jgi:hypothetical protein
VDSLSGLQHLSEQTLQTPTAGMDGRFPKTLMVSDRSLPKHLFSSPLPTSVGPIEHNRGWNLS